MEAPVEDNTAGVLLLLQQAKKNEGAKKIKKWARNYARTISRK